MPNRSNTAVIIRGIFNAKAQGIYFGEEVTQRQHAEQTYQLAKDDGADVELCIAAFLHDIGHMISPISDEFGDINHDKIGANWLREMGFSERVACISEEHVNAKRFLCRKNPKYFNKLSEASKQTLLEQGGIMNETEMRAFELQPYFHEIIKVRIWDEQAKDKNAPDIDLGPIYQQINELLFSYEI